MTGCNFFGDEIDSRIFLIYRTKRGMGGREAGLFASMFVCIMHNDLSLPCVRIGERTGSIYMMSLFILGAFFDVIERRE